MQGKYYIGMGIILLIDIIIYSIYPAINTVQPEFLGLTAFYWIQTILLIVTSALYLIISYIFRGESK
ncbi:hypothetical protein DFR86_07640 [Acidianus sulfidivorans JP7]|uniref:DUF3311 domain-containing protein n=1 Tax=Acidianus sulfidivorans JP7 TaxID=619593 RepID=A0A2U9INA7_9CREN|nr:hypothetical protein [Acidianus sulfidivorans]AWR97434.1 hypothetical protein DFR86_07640 [Acidianus sulfidivorans JP7]